MAVELPFSFTGKLTYTPDEGAPAQDVSVSLSGSYTKRSDDKVELVGADSKTIDFADIVDGAKVVLITYRQGDSLVDLQLGTKTIALSPGSTYLLLVANPDGGETAATLVSISDATLRVVVLG